MTDTLLDLLWSLLCATIVAIISYYLTNQPRQTDRFITYLSVWYLIILTINAMGHIITLAFYPLTNMCLLIGVTTPSSLITFSNFGILKTDQEVPINTLSGILVGMPMLNSLVISIYGMDRCHNHTISLKLESYRMNQTDSLITQIIQIIIHFIVYKFLILLLLFKNDIYMIIQIVLRNVFILHHEQNNSEIEMDKLSSNKDLKLELGYKYENDALNNHEHIINIAWLYFSVKVSKSLFKSEKYILRDIRGFVEFGTMMALMGPSGAGKSTFLKALMGINKNLITKESKIYCNKSFDTKSCFIAQDVRQHIISGLTVRQSIYYASRLKNLENNGHKVEHKDIIETLLKDFAIEDIKYVDIGKCSSGQQKRCILAMELCSQQKPTVVCVDEPTSGLDSHSALIVRYNL